MHYLIAFFIAFIISHPLLFTYSHTINFCSNSNILQYVPYYTLFLQECLSNGKYTYKFVHACVCACVSVSNSLHFYIPLMFYNFNLYIKIYILLTWILCKICLNFTKTCFISHSFYCQRHLIIKKPRVKCLWILKHVMF